MLRSSTLLRRSLSSNLSKTFTSPTTITTTATTRTKPNNTRIMSSSTSLTTSPFTRAVVSAMRALYPESLADKSFDNTGLLLESPLQPLLTTTSTTSTSDSQPAPSPQRLRNSVLLTIDLTRAVAAEALARRVSAVVAYHPIIFRPLKSLTLADTQQQSLLQLAAAGVSVYSPHTAVDAAPGGLGDWLADIVTGTPIGVDVRGAGGEVGGTAERDDEQQQKGAGKTTTTTVAGSRPAAPGRTYSSPAYPQVHATTESTGASGTSSNPTTQPKEAIPHTRRVIIPSSSTNDTPANEAGMGRLITFTTPQPLGSLIDRIARGVGSPKGFAVAVPQATDGSSGIEGITIRKVAVCAGSGEGVFRHAEDADLYFTGELSHHAALAATERGGCVVSLFHSNSERGYLHQVMRPKLEERVREEWEKVRAEEKEKGGQVGMLDEILADESVAVEVSERDRDPYGIVVLQEE